MKQSSIDPKEVWEVLCQLGHQTHYLATKVIAHWDEYDHSNYRALQIKAGRIKRMYGIYDTDIKQEDVYNVDSPPNTFYPSLEEALSEMQKLINDGTFKEEEVQVLSLYRKQEQ